MNDERPLWFRLELKTQVALYRYQMDNYGLKLEIPQYPVDPGETDLVKEMQKRPHSPRRVS